MRSLAAFTLIAFAITCSATENFETYATGQVSPEQARTISEHAERCFDDLTKRWFGYESRDLPRKVMITWRPRGGSGSGVTEYTWRNGRVNGGTMTVAGDWAHVMADVIPHEVMHLVLGERFATLLPLPRWVDEGLCGQVESVAEISKHDRKTIEILTAKRGIRSDLLVQMRDYPRDAVAFYAQTSSLVRFLLWKGGVERVEEVIEADRPTIHEIAKLYGYAGGAGLQEAWIEWVENGSPQIQRVLRPNYTVAQCSGSDCSDCGQPTTYAQPLAQPYIPQRSSVPRQVPPTSVPRQVPPTTSLKLSPATGATSKCPPGTVPVTNLEPVKIQVECECKHEPTAIDYDQLAKIVVTQYGDQLKGDPGDPGAPGTSQPVNIDYDQLAKVIVAQYGDQLKGPPGAPGATPNVRDIAIAVANELPPLYPQWIDKDGNVIDELPDGVRLGQTLPLRITAEILEGARP